MLMVRVPPRHQVRALQPVLGPRKGKAGPGEHARAESAVVAGECLERHGGTNPGAAAAAALDAVTDRYPDRRRAAVPVRERVEGGAVDAADFGHHLRRVRPGMRHVGVVPVDPPVDERAVVGSPSLQLRRHREGQHHVGAGADLDEQVRLLGDARALGVDDDQPCATLLSRRLDFSREVQVGHRDVVAPDHDEVGVADLLGRHPRGGAVEARIGGAPHDAAELPAREQRRPQLVKEPAVHRAAGELAVGTGVVQRQHRLRTVPRDGAGDAGVNQIESLVPGDRREGVPAAGPHALQRMRNAPGTVHELRVGRATLLQITPAV